MKPIQTVGLRMQVANALKDAIYSGALKPGDPIPEIAVAAQLNVSRGPLREAILTLEKEGLVVIHQNRGAVVRSLNPTELVEIMTLRQRLEVWALELARERMDPGALTRLGESFDAMLAAADSGNVREYSRIDLEFHRFFWEASGHHLLVETLQRVSGPLFAFADIALSQVNFDCRRIADLHKPILDYLAGRLTVPASEVLRELFQYVYGEEWDALFTPRRQDEQPKAARAPAAAPAPANRQKEPRSAL